MSAVDFLLYCCGIGVLLVSAGGAVKLMGIRSGTGKPARVQPAPSPDNDVSPAEHDLVGRLEAFQTQRYAPTIRRAPVDYTPSPGEPGGLRMVPPKLRTPPVVGKGRSFSAPKQPVKVAPSPPKPETSNVVPLPVKMPKPDDTTKKD
jgi:hypothetical protein